VEWENRGITARQSGGEIMVTVRGDDAINAFNYFVKQARRKIKKKTWRFDSFTAEHPFITLRVSDFTDEREAIFTGEIIVTLKFISMGDK